MRVHVGQHQPSARPQHAHHLADRRERVWGVVQVHVGEDGVQAAVRKGQLGPVGLVERDVLKRAQVLPGHLEHRRRPVYHVDPADERGQPGGHKPGPRADIRDLHLRAQVGPGDRRLAHGLAEIAAPHVVPAPGYLLEILG